MTLRFRLDSPFACHVERSVAKSKHLQLFLPLVRPKPVDRHPQLHPVNTLPRRNSAHPSHCIANRIFHNFAD